MNKKQKDDPVLAVTYIHDPEDRNEDRCVLQVYEHVGKALSGEIEHLIEQGFKGPHYAISASYFGINVSAVRGDCHRAAKTSFFKLSQLKPGFSEKFS